MADGGSVRKSGRGSMPSRRYTIDAFEGLDIPGSSGESEAERFIQGDDSDLDQDFYGGVSEDDDEASSLDGSTAPDGAPQQAPSLIGEDDTMKLDETAKPVDGVSDTRDAVRLRQRQTQPQVSSRPRGLSHAVKYAAKDQHIIQMFGENADDIIPILQARDKWADDATFPSRSADRHGIGGMGHLFAQSAEKRDAETARAGRWCRETDRRRIMARLQDMQVLKADDALHFLSNSTPFLAFRMGPYGRQKTNRLAPYRSISVHEAWKPVHEDDDAVKPRYGWLLNVGAKVQSMDWAPCHDGSVQYLAITTHKRPPRKHRARSAFLPGEPYPASIQIWGFTAPPSESGQCASVHGKARPKLLQVVCSDWGVAREVKWCPVVCRHDDEGDGDKVSVGLLAVVWSDGCIRVLDVQVDRVHDASQVYVHYRGAAFQARPPTTVCTCLAWLSSTDLAAGCANGYVAIWNLPLALSRAGPSASKEDVGVADAAPSATKPYLYHPFSTTYIFSICSAAPLHPYLLVTSSASGYHRLTDLRSPTFDYVLHSRNRLGSAPLVFHPHLQCFIAPAEPDLLHMMQIRRFFQTTKISKMSSQITSVAVSAVHASVLIGCADGSVSCTNPTSRALDGRKQPHWVQKWFVHEWIATGRPTTADGAGSRTEDDGHDQREGLSRVTESYRPESINDQARFQRAGPGSYEHLRMLTIHEEESAATAVAWNQNLHCGGWAAAGMGDGLVRVEDVAI